MRTLPIRVEPVAQESLTSWLCALAHRNAVTWQQILTAVGLHHRPGDMKRLGWAAQLHPAEVADLAASTGIGETILQQMTLARFEHLGITTGRRPPYPDFGAEHGARPIQYCATCLRDSGGRWQLRWSLGWSFACVEHGRLLSDACPRCNRRPQRRTPQTRRIPGLLLCSQPDRDEPTARLCGADLRTMNDTPKVTAEMIDAQRTINAVIEGTVDGFPIYGGRLVPSRQILTDLRATTRRVLIVSSAAEAVVPEDNRVSATSSAVKPRGHRLDTGPSQNAAAFTAAVNILRAPDCPTGAALLRDQLCLNGHRSHYALPFTRWRRAMSAEFVAVHLGAVGPRLPAQHQLRYRTSTALPRLPKRPETTLAKVVRALPTALWLPWAHRVDPDCVNDSAARIAFSCAVALVGTNADIDTVATLLNSPVNTDLLAKMLKRVSRSPGWQTAAATITTLADHLAADKSPPINYHRRRETDYTTLLSDDQWACLTGEHPRGREPHPWGPRPARCALYADLSGFPVEHAPWFIDSPTFRDACRAFGTTNSTGLREAGVSFLRAHGIDEPVREAPPFLWRTLKPSTTCEYS